MALARAPFTVERFLRRPPPLRALAAADGPVLADLLWEAASEEPTVRALGRRHALALPVLARHVRGWGRPGDGGLAADGADGTPVGAAWYRLFPPGERGGGVVAWPGVPQVMLVVRPAAREAGIGGTLLDALAGQAGAAGHRRLVAVLEPGNPAARLFRRHGWEVATVGDRHAGPAALLIRELP